MKKLRWILTALVLIVGCGDGYDFCGGTMESKPQEYTKTEVISPYYIMDSKLWMTPMGCNEASCDYAVSVIVRVYNPTNKLVVADVYCKWLLDEDYEAAKGQRLGIKIPANGKGTKGNYKKIELQQIVGTTAGQRSSIGVTCEANFR